MKLKVPDRCLCSYIEHKARPLFQIVSDPQTPKRQCGVSVLFALVT